MVDQWIKEKELWKYQWLTVFVFLSEGTNWFIRRLVQSDEKQIAISGRYFTDRDLCIKNAEDYYHENLNKTEVVHVNYDDLLY